MQEIAYGRTLLNTALEAKLSTRAPDDKILSPDRFENGKSKHPGKIKLLAKIMKIL